MKSLTIADRAARLGLRFDARGLRELVLIDRKMGKTYDFQDSDALRDFLTIREIEEQRLRNQPLLR